MTSPVTSCACGTAHLGDCPGPLSWCMTPGYLFEGVILLRNRLTGKEQDWPAGTAARLRLHWGTGTELIIPGVVEGPRLLFDMTPEETTQVPRGALMAIDLNYDNGDPDRWRPWRVGRSNPCR